MRQSDGVGEFEKEMVQIQNVFHRNFVLEITYMLLFMNDIYGSSPEVI